MKRVLIAVALIACASACPAQSQKQGLVLDADVSQAGSVRLVVRNTDAIDHEISDSHAFAGTVGGNVHLFAVDALGRHFPPCARVESLTPWNAPATIHPGDAVEVSVVTGEQLVRWHCLLRGKYSVEFAYQLPDGDLISSRALTLTVDGENVVIAKN